MPISLKKERQLFPPEINGVRVVFNNSADTYSMIPRGSVVLLEKAKGKLRDEFGDKIGEAYFYNITAYHDGQSYYETDLRMTRWMIGGFRWGIHRRLARKIRKAAKYVKPSS